MAARVGMANLINRLRALCNAGTADTTVAGTTFWSDDQLQDRLDETRIEWRSMALEAIPTADNPHQYFDYAFPAVVGKYFEEAGTGSGFAVRDASENVVTSSLYTVNYEARLVTFNANQNSASYSVDLRSYSLYEAAAGIWREKAAFTSNKVTWSSDNHKIDAGAQYDRCMQMAKEMQRKAGAIKSGRFFRDDEFNRA